MHIAVTGGSGDLGRALIPHLLEHGHSVTSIDRALPNGEHTPGVRRMVADVTDFGQFVGAIHGCEALIHLAAHRSPMSAPQHVVYNDNTAASYNALTAAATLGMKRVCLASSINATGAAFSAHPRYDYFPLDEHHPTYAEDPYSLSKWVLEAQADMFVRRYPTLCVASLRFHWLVASGAHAREMQPFRRGGEWKDLWGYTAMPAAARACLLAVTTPFTGHERFYIVAPHTFVPEPTADLVQARYPDTPVRRELTGNQGLYDCSRAAQVLGWQHGEDE